MRGTHRSRAARASDALADAALPPTQSRVAAATAALILALGYVVVAGHGLRQGALFVVGLAIGFTLYQSRFGFASAYRHFLRQGQGAPLRAQMLLLALTSLFFAPILASRIDIFGVQPHGFVYPIGVGTVVGALLFGVGMQLGGGCAAGTLYAVGGGHVDSLLTLGGFLAGSVLGAWSWPFWARTLPSLPAISLAHTALGYGGALAVQLAACGLIALVTVVVSRRRQPPPLERPPGAAGLARLVRGSWPLWVGAILLAALNALTLLLKGTPWDTSSGYALWGGHLLQAMGIAVSSWPYWAAAGTAPLAAPLLADAVTVMNLGLLLGAAFAAALAGTFLLHRPLPWRTVAATVLGGLLMGYGARVSQGCNIGSYLSSIASFGLHGWVWGAAALVGTVIGLPLRPWLQVDPPKASDADW